MLINDKKNCDNVIHWILTAVRNITVIFLTSISRGAEIYQQKRKYIEGSFPVISLTFLAKRFAPYIQTIAATSKKARYMSDTAAA